MLSRHNHLYFSIAIIIDSLAINIGWILTYYFRFRLGIIKIYQSNPPPLREFAELLPIVLLCNIVALAGIGMYRLSSLRSFFKQVIQIIKAAGLGWLGLLAVLYFYRDYPYSRYLLVSFLIISPVSLVCSRLVLRKIMKLLRKRGWGIRTAAIIGTGRLAQRTFHKLQDAVWLGIKPDYFIDENEEQEREKVFGAPVRGDLSNMVEVLKEYPVDCIFVAIGGKHRHKMEDVLEILAKLPITVCAIPDFTGVITLQSSVGELDGLPVIQLRDTPIQGWNAIAKRIIDLFCSAVLLIFLSPLMLLIAILVKLTSKGPMLFKQERMGLGGRPFTMLKFRTMRIDAETETGPVWASENDPRCTKFGSFLRKTSLDELPQFINVFMGDMSLVGPRPERPHFVREFTDSLPAYMLRHNVKAGITGWAQINGLRGQSSLKKRLHYDLYYINNWSMGFDLLILLLTPFVIIFHKNAY